MDNVTFEDGFLVGQESKNETVYIPLDKVSSIGVNTNKNEISGKVRNLWVVALMVISAKGINYIIKSIMEC